MPKMRGTRSFFIPACKYDLLVIMGDEEQLFYPE